jgi:hypothetical protein
MNTNAQHIHCRQCLLTEAQGKRSKGTAPMPPLQPYLAPGMYFYQLMANGRLVESGKIMIQR